MKSFSENSLSRQRKDHREKSEDIMTRLWNNVFCAFHDQSSNYLSPPSFHHSRLKCSIFRSRNKKTTMKKKSLSFLYSPFFFVYDTLWNVQDKRFVTHGQNRRICRKTFVVFAFKHLHTTWGRRMLQFHVHGALHMRHLSLIWYHPDANIIVLFSSVRGSTTKSIMFSAFAKLENVDLNICSYSHTT